MIGAGEFSQSSALLGRRWGGLLVFEHERFYNKLCTNSGQTTLNGVVKSILPDLRGNLSRMNLG